MNVGEEGNICFCVKITFIFICFTILLQVSPLQKENPFPHTYRLSYRVKGETTYKEIILNGGSVNHTLPNLQKETVYDIQLCALGNKDRNKFCINMTTHITAGSYDDV